MATDGGGVDDDTEEKEELDPDLLKKIQERYMPVRPDKLYSFETISFGDTAVDLYCLHHVMSWENVELGEAVWPSAKILSRYLLDNPDLVRDVSVLELGCGPGLTGLVAAKLSRQPSRVLLTDNCQLVLEELVPRSIQHNFPHTEDRPECVYLHWGADLPRFQQKYGSFDVILGADVIYWTEYVEPLLQTVSQLLSLKPSSSFITIYEERYLKAPDTTVPEMLNIAHKYNLTCSNIPLENNPEYQEARKQKRNFKLYSFMRKS
ncbi:PREDICTED: protein N-lysine methyltransferase METTL21A-like [Branchiostoma belcheri]|uniref:Protein N-lysine methyltransferase METTL21A-like n=1 Tax=Branchiostoma belcheri TaxID=7741 RepID=A0A6P4XK92_BRABE|nr:PREDICTED: protein N-lysine methyltransferase METTL21A-like [Branchiostoma belcheri]